MVFDPNLHQGEILSNSELCKIFKCAPQGGMRKSNKTNTLVLVSNHTKSLYEDRWEDDIFHYTGMGQTGDQSLDFSQNKTLNESNHSTIDVFLFEVFTSRKYFYQGKVKLVDTPYIERQLDKNQRMRNVWIFPLKLVDDTVPLIPEDTFINKTNRRQQLSKKSSTNDLFKRLKNSSNKPGVRYIISKQYERNQDVVEYVKRKANGYCQLCGNKAPFKNKNDEPFLEVHHIKWLSNGGEDSIENAVALCPNCHRKMHILNLEQDKKILRKNII